MKRTRLNLLASCSIAAVLVASCPPAALAIPPGCAQVGSGGVTNPSGATVVGYCVTNTSFSGAIANEGTISPLGITLSNGTINGQITSSGVIAGGISLDQNSKIISTKTAILITGPTFTGGISNAGTISAGSVGIFVTGVSQLGSSSAGGGISNSGTISAAFQGVAVDGAGTFSGGISNSGTISATGLGGPFGTGIYVGVGTFSSGISNSGAISAANAGIGVGNIVLSYVDTFSGGISNSGKITAGGPVIGSTGFAVGMVVGGLSTFSGGISNSGTIAVGATNSASSMVGFSVVDVSVINVSNNFLGGISNAASGVMSVNVTNSGTISGGVTGIQLTSVLTFSGGIANAGLISVNVVNSGDILGVGERALTAGVFVSNVSTFSGGISNSGTISVGVTNSTDGTISGGVAGVAVSGVSNFSGGVNNSGAILVSVANSGSIAGTIAGITVASVSTFSGNISNSGTISAANGIVVGAGVGFASGSAIINSGTIIGSTAAIDVSAATSPVMINQTGGLISGAIKLSASPDVLNISGGSIAGNILGRGSSDTINFAPGAGRTFSYASPYGFSGVNQVNINSGTVILNGVNSATDIAVNSGGALAGAGTLTATAASTLKINSGGTLSPGVPGSVGTLTVNGNVVFASGATYQDTFNGANAGLTTINGAATLGGASVIANGAGSSVTPGVQYLILADTSGGLGVGGNIFNPSVSYGGYTGTLTYSANGDDVYLTFAGAAGCFTGSFPSSNSGSIPCIKASGTSFAGNIVNAASGVINPGSSSGVGIMVSNATITGNISNAGAISAPIGISLVGATINGAIVDSGVIQATGGGLFIDAASKIVATKTAIAITGPSFSGGIANAGTISHSGGLAGDGIQVGGFIGLVTNFSGGVSNSGTIAGFDNGIALYNINTFSGGITNSGAITAVGGAGIAVYGVSVSTSSGGGMSSFAGGISNSGTISGGSIGILVDFVSTFSGAISNSGLIAAGGYGTGIEVYGVSTFSGGISNSGTISGAGAGILVSTSSTFSGGISNSGAISAVAAGSGIGIGIAVGDVSTFSGGITNSGVITAVGAAGGGFGVGIGVGLVSAFSGGISNSGAITAVGVAGVGSGVGIGVGFVSAFSGGIGNSGTISAASGTGGGVLVLGVSSFAGGISNSGAISSAGVGVGVGSGGALFTKLCGNGGCGSLTSQFVGVSTFAGNISNSGTIAAKTGIAIGAGVNFVSGSAIVNSGTIAGSTAAIDASAATSPVTIDQTGGLISGAIKLSAYADTLNITGGAIAGNIVGQGSSNTINFAPGAGNSFTYASAYGFSGINQVNVNSGQVILDGANSANHVTINSGGALEVGDASNSGATLTSASPVAVYGTMSGHGALFGGAVIEPGGILAPGGSIGALKLYGNLSFAPASFYAVAITPSAASKTQISGSAALGGATVVVMPQLGTYGRQTYTILTASNALGAGNVFNPKVDVTQSGLIANPTLSYDSNDVYLTIGSYTKLLNPPRNAPYNAQNAAGVINNAILSGAPLPGGLQNLDKLSGAGQAAALNQLVGQQQGSFGLSGFKAGDMFLNLLLNPYIAGRGDFGASTAPTFLSYAADPVAGADRAFTALAPAEKAGPGPAPVFWGAAYGGSETVSGNATSGAARTSGSIYGFAGGADYRIEPNAIVGLALAGGGTGWGLGQGMGSGRSDMFQAGVYGSLHAGPAYVATAFGYSLHDATTTRSGALAGVGSQNGSFTANVVSQRLEGGYGLPVSGGVTLTPYAANQVQAMFLPSFAETAAGGAGSAASLTYGSRNFATDRTELGAWLDYVTPGFGGALKIYARAAWAHDFNDQSLTTASFQSISGGSFYINSAKPSPNGALFTLGGEYDLGDGWSILAKFDGEFSSTTNIYSATGQIRKTW